MLPAARFLSLLRLGLIACGILALGGHLVAKPDALMPTYRRVIVRVVDENGEPMPGVNVQLLGTGRDALQAMELESDEDPLGVWRFVSDARGRCVVRLGCFKGFDSEKLVGKSAPGWGRFYFIAEAGHLHGVSLGIIHEPEGKLARDTYAYEWNRNGVLRTSDRPLVATLRLRRGLRVSGRVIDTAGQPVHNYVVGVQHDLGSEHHTGYGNEIFKHSTTTDRNGRFLLPDIFPNTFYLRAAESEDDLPVWVRTRLRGRWSPVPVDKITPGRAEKVIRMTLVVAHQPPYRYSGRILDQEGKAVPGAEIILGISRHRESQDYADDHTSLKARSDQDGRFEFRTATNFIRWVIASAPGLAEYSQDYENKKAPHQWNITLHPPKE